MKLSRLELEAFGPFAGHEVVDFDALAPHGLFLLNGATGSGKTSVLDAICYALYGQVPGQRAGQNLRSDHADTETGPWVSLEFTTKGRRLKIRRNLPWERPKQRGTGTTPERAKALLQEHPDGQWQSSAAKPPKKSPRSATTWHT
ncbi:AAA family ATPase [Arthrobacter sp. Y-9]|uniref:AAA family ATPase n=1 Tax=Arthrobacter sp. Y-9 TaxID=3039385 RepID=UPI00241C31C4|nr:AAA family ATPase [Arthrobacter sp. Y-9]WFR84302.1 AAA family ATPase [Arthrobacter sp. Y-9]